MITNTDNLLNLEHKIDYEGGMVEYICGYGGDMPDELKAEVDAVKLAVEALNTKYRALLEEFGVEPL